MIIEKLCCLMIEGGMVQLLVCMFTPAKYYSTMMAKHKRGIMLLKFQKNSDTWVQHLVLNIECHLSKH